MYPRIPFSVLSCLLLLLSIGVNAQRIIDLNDDLRNQTGRLGVLDNQILEGFKEEVRSARVFRLNKALQQAEGLSKGDAIALQLFEGKAYESKIDRVTTDVNGTVTIAAAIPGYPMAHAVITTASDGRSLVSIHIPERSESYTTWVRDGESYLLEIDEAQMAPLRCGGAIDPHKPVQEAFPLHNRAASDRQLASCAGPVFGENQDAAAAISVLMVYTPAAAAWSNTYQGGIANTIANGLSLTQTVWNNSQVNATIELAHSAQIAYAETGSSFTDLTRIQAQGDGFLDDVHQLRKAYQADLVVLVTYQLDNAGLAFLLNNESGSMNNGFSVIRVDYISGYALAHEIGHNLGLDHDSENSDYYPALRPYAYGWSWQGTNGTQYRCVMAYTPGSQVAYYSNPALIHQGTPAGDAAQANGARLFREAKHVVANYSNKISLLLSPPQNLEVTATSETGASIKWGAVESSQSYQVWFQEAGGGGSWSYYWGITATHFTLNSSLFFKPATTYKWRIAAINSCGDASMSSESSFTTSGSLPVRLAYFTGETSENNTINLRWSASMETNAWYYALERSHDASNFGEIARVPAKSETDETTTYIHTDETPLRGRNYYRLRQVDRDDSFTYTPIVSVLTSAAGAPYPNPARDGVIRVEASRGAALKLTDLTGREIPFTARRIDEALTEIRPAQNLPPGVYVVSVDGTGYRVVVEP